MCVFAAGEKIARHSNYDNRVPCGYYSIKSESKITFVLKEIENEAIRPQMR
jgi:hypothetical protein